MKTLILILTLITFAIPAFAGTYDDIGVKAKEAAAKPKPVKEKKCYDDACRTEQWVKTDPMAQNGHVQTAYLFKSFTLNRDNILNQLYPYKNMGRSEAAMTCQQLVGSRGMNGFQCGSNSGQFSAYGTNWVFGNGFILNASGFANDGISYNVSSKLYTVSDDKSGKKIVFRIDGYDINKVPTIDVLKRVKLTIIEANLPQASSQAAQYLNSDGGSNLTLSTLYRVLNDLWQGYASVNSGTAFEFASLMITDPDTTSEAIRKYFEVNAKK